MPKKSDSDKTPAKKPDLKPYPDFPLTPHGREKNRSWVKKINGKLYYFGPFGDPDAALAKYLEQRDDLYAGRKPRPKVEGITLVELCENFLEYKEARRVSGELSDRTFYDYQRNCQSICDALGKTRVVCDLFADDFEKLRTAFKTRQSTVVDKSRKKLKKTKRAKADTPKSAVSLANSIRLARTLFKWAYENSKIDKPLRYGNSFESPSRKQLRQERNAKLPRMFSADELRLILQAAKPGLRAMALLAINCAFGQTDVASLPRKAIDLKNGWIDFPRPKTAVPRRCKLWPETVEALEAVSTYKAKSPEDADLLFITKQGARFVRTGKNGTVIDSVGLEFKKLLKLLKINREGLNFYAVRHTFQTVADEVSVRNVVATQFIMGHAPSANDMSANYRELVSDARISEVTDSIRLWLWPQGSELAWIESERKPTAKDSGPDKAI